MTDATTPDGPDDATDGLADAAASVPPVVHLYVLLDRSGSMASIADDVVGGFNHLLAEQQADGGDALLTLVQFDSHDPQEVLIDAVPVREVTPLEAGTFQPRASTPLLDATGRLLARAGQRVRQRSDAGLPAEEILVVSITDGHENASCELTLDQVRQMVDRRTAEGWTFVFLSAALDVYAEAGGLGYDVRSTQSFAADPLSTGTAMQSLSRATSAHRAKVRRGERFDKGDFWEGDKPAEEDRNGG